MDLRDGPVSVRVVGPAVSTNAVTPPGKPIQVAYEAVDAAGNVARRTRLVTILDDCTQRGEFRCPDTLLCSVFRSCSAALSAALGQATGLASAADVTGPVFALISTETTQKAVERPPDTIAPTIRISGTGQLYTADGGISGMINFVFVGWPYTDAGATADDVVPSGGEEPPAVVNLTQSIVTRVRNPSGAVVGAVSTDAPTGTDATGGLPYTVSYDVVDASGNRAATVYRRVYVLCRPPEFECPRNDTEEPRSCSAGGICGAALPHPASVLVLGLAPGSGTAVAVSSSGTTANNTGNDGADVSTFTLIAASSASSASTSSAAIAATDSVLGAGIPRLMLNSASSLAVPRGAAYVPCRGDVTSQCDPGATATLNATGDLSPQVRACATGVSDPQPFDVVGLQYCNIDTRSPGTYTITFHLTWPSVGELVIYRQLVVEDECSGGERVCADGMCSLEGWCAGDLRNSTASSNASASVAASSDATSGAGIFVRSNGAGQGTSASDLSVALGSAATGDPSANANTPPRLSLATTAALGLKVSVPKGTAYARCAEGQVPTEELPCELLGIAADTEDGDLTPMIAMCPPTDCAKTHCRAHWADRKQPSECGVDTVNARVGSTFRLQLVVFDSAGENATVERVVTVASPCPDGQFTCEESDAAGASTSIVCSDVACSERLRLSSAGTSAYSLGSNASSAAPPRLFLLPGLHAANLSQAETNQTAFLVYMQPAPWSLAPCATFATGLPPQPASCAAIANGSAGADLTPDINASVKAVCPAGTTCSSCTAASLTVGACLPGRYQVVYEVSEDVTASTSSNSQALSTARQLDVYVERLTWQVFNFAVYPNATAARSLDKAAAEAFAASLAANASARLEFLSPILQALGVTSGSIRSIALLAAPAVEGVPLGPSYPPPPAAAMPPPGSSASAPPPSAALAYTIRVVANVTTGSTDGYYTQDDSLETDGTSALETTGGNPPPSGAASRRLATTGTNSAETSPGDMPFAVAEALGLQSSAHTRQQPGSSQLASATEFVGAPGLQRTVAGALGSALHRRGLQQTASGCVDVSQFANTASVAATAAGSLGLASVDASSNACSSPAPDELSIALSQLIGAVADLEAQTQQALDDQATAEALIAALDDKFTRTDEAYREQIVAMSAAAIQAHASAYDRAEQMLALQEATLAAQNASSVAMAAVLSLLQATLNEAQAAATLSRLTTTQVLGGIGASAGDAAGNASEYASCLFARGSGAAFAFRVATYSGAAASSDAAYSSQAGNSTGGNGSSNDTGLRHRRLHSLRKAAFRPGSGAEEAQKAAFDVRGSSPFAALCRWPLPQSVRALICGTGAPSDAAPPRSGSVAGEQHTPHAAASLNTDGQPSADALLPHRSSHGRSLTAVGIGGGSGTDSADGSGGMLFSGYNLPSGEGYDYSLWEARELERQRFAGLRNHVLVGLMLHQERRGVVAATGRSATSGAASGTCRSSAFPHLVPGCVTTSSSTGTAASLGGAANTSDAQSSASGGLGGIGTDPVFSRFSALYEPSLNPADWYNTSQGSPERNAAGLPYGFYHEPLERFPPGYPLLFDTRMSAQRAEQAITFVRDGGYLSSSYTKSLRAQLVTYNPGAQVFGYWRVDFSWADSGVIDTKTYLMGLPAISYGDSISNLDVSKFLPDFFMVLLVAAYWCMTAYDIVRQLQAQRGRIQLAASGAAAAAPAPAPTKRNRVRPGRAGGKGYLYPEDEAFEDVDGSGHRKYTPRMGAKWVIYEAAVCAVMAAAVAVFYTYAVRLSVRDDFAARYDVYDADAYAPARYFLLRRRDGVAATSDASGVSAAAALTAGAPGRYKAEADPQPLQDAGTMLARVDDMYNTVVLYTFLQGLVLLAIVVRWLHYISFQSHLSIIVGTFALALPDLLHFALVVVTCIIMFGAAACLAFGPSTARLSDIGSSINLMLQYVLLYDDAGVFRKLLSPVRERGGAERVLAVLMYALGPIFFLFVLSSFILAFLAWPFGELKYAVAGMPGVPQDLARILGWYWQRIAYRAPKNKLLQRWLEAWLAQDKSRGFMYRVHKHFANAYKSITGLNMAPGAGASRAPSDASLKPSKSTVLWVASGNKAVNGVAISNALRAISRARLQPLSGDAPETDDVLPRSASATSGIAALRPGAPGSAGINGGITAGIGKWRRAAASAAAGTENQLRIDLQTDVATADAADPSSSQQPSPRAARGDAAGSPTASLSMSRRSQGSFVGRTQGGEAGSARFSGGAGSLGARAWPQSGGARRSVDSDLMLPHALPANEDEPAGSEGSRTDLPTSLPLPPLLESCPDAAHEAAESARAARALLFPKVPSAASVGDGSVAHAAGNGAAPGAAVHRFGPSLSEGARSGLGSPTAGTSGSASRPLSPKAAAGAPPPPLPPSAALTSVDMGVLSALLDRQDGKSRLRNALTVSRLTVLGRGGAANAEPVRSVREPDAAALLADAVMANLLSRFGRDAAGLVAPGTSGAAGSSAAAGAAGGGGGGGAGGAQALGRGGVLLAARGRSRPPTNAGMVASMTAGADAGAAATVTAPAAAGGAWPGSAGGSLGLIRVRPPSALSIAESDAEPAERRSDRQGRVPRRATFNNGTPLDPDAWAFRVSSPVNTPVGPGGAGGSAAASGYATDRPGPLDSAIERRVGDKLTVVIDSASESGESNGPDRAVRVASAGGRLAARQPRGSFGSAAAGASRRVPGLSASEGGEYGGQAGAGQAEVLHVQPQRRASQPDPEPVPAAAALATAAAEDRKLQPVVSMPAAISSSAPRMRSRLAASSLMQLGSGAGHAARLSSASGGDGGAVLTVTSPDGVRGRTSPVLQNARPAWVTEALGSEHSNPMSPTGLSQPGSRAQSVLLTLPPQLAVSSAGPGKHPLQHEDSGRVERLPSIHAHVAFGTVSDSDGLDPSRPSPASADVTGQSRQPSSPGSGSSGGASPSGLAAAAAAAAMPLLGGSPRAAASLTGLAKGNDQQAARPPLAAKASSGSPVAEAKEMLTHGSARSIRVTPATPRERPVAAAEAAAVVPFTDGCRPGAAESGAHAGTDSLPTLPTLALLSVRAEPDDEGGEPGAMLPTIAGGAVGQQQQQQQVQPADLEGAARLPEDGEFALLDGSGRLSGPRAPRLVTAVLSLTSQLESMKRQLVAAMGEVQDMADLLAALVLAAEAVPATSSTNRRTAVRAAVLSALAAYLQEHPRIRGRQAFGGHSVLEEAVLPLEPQAFVPRAWTPPTAQPPMEPRAFQSPDASACMAPAPASFTSVHAMPVSQDSPQRGGAAAPGGVQQAAGARLRSVLSRPDGGVAGHRPTSAFHSPQPAQRGRLISQANQHPNWDAVRRTLAASGPAAAGLQGTGDDAAVLSALVAASGNAATAETGGANSALAGAAPVRQALQRQASDKRPASQQQRRGWAARRGARAAAETRFAEESMAAASAAAAAASSDEQTSAMPDGRESPNQDSAIDIGPTEGAEAAQTGNGNSGGLRGWARLKELHLMSAAGANGARRGPAQSSSGALDGGTGAGAGAGQGARVWSTTVRMAAEAAKRDPGEEPSGEEGFVDVFRRE